METPEQRRDDLAAETRRRGDAQLAAGGTIAQLTHVFQRLSNTFYPRLTILIKEFAFTRQRRTARRAQKQTCIELSLEFLHVAADGGTTDAEAVARAGKAAFVGDGQKGNDAGVAGRKTACERVGDAGGAVCWAI